MTASGLDIRELERVAAPGDPRLRAADPARQRVGEGAGRGRHGRSPQRDRAPDRGAALGPASADRAPAAHRVRPRDRPEPRRRSDHAAGLMDPRLLDYYNHELQHLRETGAEFAAAVSQDRRPARRGGRGRGRRPLRRAPARGLRVPGGPGPAQARRRVPALHAARCSRWSIRTTSRRRRRWPWSQLRARAERGRPGARARRFRAAAS